MNVLTTCAKRTRRDWHKQALIDLGYMDEPDVEKVNQDCTEKPLPRILEGGCLLYVITAAKDI